MIVYYHDDIPILERVRVKFWIKFSTIENAEYKYKSLNSQSCPLFNEALVCVYFLKTFLEAPHHFTFLYL